MPPKTSSAPAAAAPIPIPAFAPPERPLAVPVLVAEEVAAAEVVVCEALDVGDGEEVGVAELVADEEVV